MKRHILLMTFVLVSLFVARAQEYSNFQDRVTIGVKGGLSFPDMRYSDVNLDIYRHNTFCRGSATLFGNFDIWKGFSVRPEFTYIGRGTKLNYQDDIHYQLRASYFDIRLPIMYSFLKDYMIQPYVYRA